MKLLTKISRELEEFKEEALRMGKEEIFSIAYRIDCMIGIYEMLAEHSGEFREEELKRCVQEEGLLQSLYQRWLKSPAPQEGELEHSVWSGIKETCRDAGKEVPEEAEEKKNQKYPKPKEGRVEREEKPLGIHGGQKIGKNNGTQGMQKKRAPRKNQGTQGKENVYGKADSDQKPAA